MSLADSNSDLSRLVQRAEAVLARLEAVLPPPPPAIDWQAATAFRWRRQGRQGWLEPVRHPHQIKLADLVGVTEQKKRLEQNTRQFLQKSGADGANNVLLTGARGTGKSSLIKAVFNAYARKGLRLIEVDRNDLIDLPALIDQVAQRPERFIVYCDDLSFEAAEPGYKALKSALEGSIAGTPANLLIYATSNRRHLMPEFMEDNLATQRVDGGEIHPGEATEEKVSLSERFGLWLSFYPFDQDLYLAICEHWLMRFGLTAQQAAAAHPAALNWSLLRGARSGRIAWQFAKDFSGKSAN